MRSSGILKRLNGQNNETLFSIREIKIYSYISTPVVNDINNGKKN